MAGLSAAEDDPEVDKEVGAEAFEALLASVIITCKGALGGEANIESAEAADITEASEAVVDGEADGRKTRLLEGLGFTSKIDTVWPNKSIQV